MKIIPKYYKDQYHNGTVFTNFYIAGFINDKNEIFYPYESINDFTRETQIESVIELKDKIIFESKGVIICLNKKTKQIIWTIEPPIEWQPKYKTYQYYYHGFSDTYTGIDVFLKDKKGKTWQYAKRHGENHKYEPYKKYKNKTKYKLVSHIYDILKSNNELVQDFGYEKNTYSNDDVSGGIIYANISNYPLEDCLMVAHAGDHYYEVDIKTGQITPACSVYD